MDYEERGYLHVINGNEDPNLVNYTNAFLTTWALSIHQTVNVPLELRPKSVRQPPLQTSPQYKNYN